MSHFRRPHAALIAALCLAFTGAASAEATAIELAHQAYHRGQFQHSLKLYQQLAAAGNAEAAERAGYMLMHGPATYGPQVPRDPSRATALLEQAADAGRPNAVFVLGMMSGSD
jgi:TPR repeat protein